MLRLVEGGRGKDESLVVLGIATQKSIAGNDQIMIWDFRKSLRAFGAFDGQYAQIGTKNRCLPAPIPNEGGWTYNEVRAR